MSSVKDQVKEHVCILCLYTHKSICVGFVEWDIYMLIEWDI